MKNVIWIVLDHVQFYHYKKTTGARPVLNGYEELAADGVEFTRCKSVHPLCMPARASMMMGVYSHKHNQLRNTGKERIINNIPTVFDHLINAGYQVGYFGKNHSGIENYEDYGIDGFYPPGYGDPYATDEYKRYLKRKELKNPIYHEEWSMAGTGDLVCDMTEAGYTCKGSSGYLEGNGENHEAAFVFDLALDYIAENKEKPFCVRIDTWGPHQTYTPPESYDGVINEEDIEKYPSFDEYSKERSEFALNYIDHVRNKIKYKEWKDYRKIVKRAYEQYSFIDTRMKSFLDKLKEAGLYENSVIILTADHGDGLASNGGMFDKSGDLQEELMSIPLVVKPAGDVKTVGDAKNKKCNAFVSNLDVPATVLDACGMKIPDYYDSLSLLPLITGETDHERQGIMCQHYGHRKIYLKQRCYYEGDFKFIIDELGIKQLYNLKEDPFEQHNIKDEVLLERMQTGLDKTLEQYNDEI